MTSGKAYGRIRSGRCSDIYGKKTYIDGVYGPERYPRDVLKVKDERLRFAGGGERTTHTSQKPLALCEWLVKSYTNPGETVLDPFMGSGSTGVACVQTGRKFIGCELDKHFFDVAQNRLKTAVDNFQYNLFEETGENNG